MTSMMSNVDVYLDIAQEALTQSRNLSAAQTRPGPGGGLIKVYDPGRHCFKQSLIAIVFAGIFLEARVYIEGCRQFGASRWDRLERKARTYEEKLRALGVTDGKILLACTSFRQARNDVVHERAMELPSVTPRKLRRAQREAEDALALVRQVDRALQPV